MNILDGGISEIKHGGCLSQIARQILANVRSAWRRRRLIIVIIPIVASQSREKGDAADEGINAAVDARMSYP